MRAWACAGWLPIVLLVGCGPADNRQAVSGTVVFRGAPLKTGTIEFVPEGGQGSSSGAAIQEGKFSIPKASGLLPGKYLVRVTAGDGKTRINSEEDAGGPGGDTNIVSVDLIPPEWAEASTQTVEVQAGKGNEFAFDIPKAREAKGKKR